MSTRAVRPTNGSARYPRADGADHHVEGPTAGFPSRDTESTRADVRHQDDHGQDGQPRQSASNHERGETAGRGHRRDGRDVEQENRGDCRHPVRTQARISHHLEPVRDVPASQQPVGRVGQPVEVDGARQQAERGHRGSGAQERRRRGPHHNQDRPRAQPHESPDRRKVGASQPGAGASIRIGHRQDSQEGHRGSQGPDGQTCFSSSARPATMSSERSA